MTPPQFSLREDSYKMLQLSPNASGFHRYRRDSAGLCTSGASAEEL